MTTKAEAAIKLGDVLLNNSVKQVAELKAVIRELLDALDAEAKAEMVYQNAKNNFSGDLKPYIENGAKAALATLLAIKKAREAIK